MTDASETPRPARTGPTADDEISLWEVLAVLVRRRGTIVLTTIVMVGLAIGSAFIGTRSYTTTATFRPQSSEASSSQLMALASQFGVNVGGAAAEEASPQFYAELLESRALFSIVASETYDVQGVGKTTLADLLEIEQDTEELRLEKVYDWLEQTAVSVSVATQTGTITLEVVTDWPDLSHAIAERLLSEVTRFNMEVRQSQARAEREFISARVDSAEVELRTAEAGLRRFLEANRQWENAPLLVLEHDRLQREVTRKNSVLETLIQSREQARIAEVRDTPVITVIQSPFLPPGPDERRLVLRAALGVVLGGMAGIVLAFVVEALRSPVAGDPAREDFVRSWEGFKSSLPFAGRRA